MKQDVREYETSNCHCERSEAISLIIWTFEIASSLRSSQRQSCSSSQRQSCSSSQRQSCSSSQRHYSRTDWKERLLACLLLLVICFNTGIGQPNDETIRKQDTWLTPLAEQQLYIEGLDDRKGLGRIFVPAMTSGSNEPNYAVFQNDELMGQRNMGESFFLKPGTYTVVLGSGNLDQRVRREVSVGREETVILHPDWSALTIEVIDETRNYFKQNLQVFRVETAESYGIIPAINPELGEHLQTLILQPGLYKIVGRGEDFNTYVNFATVLLEPYSYTPFTVVIDSETKNFIGAGILTTLSQLRQRRNWSIFGAIHGNFNITSKNAEDDDESKNNYTLRSTLENRLLYDNFPHYYLSNNLLKLEALRQEGKKFQISQDYLTLKNTYVYYILNWLGGYSRLSLTTHLFETMKRFDSPKNVAYIDQRGITFVDSINKVRLEPSIYPLELKEGLGINVTPVKTFNAHLNLRLGLGYWQTYNNEVYRRGLDIIHETDTDTLTYISYKQAGNNYQNGLETALVSNLSLLHNVSITTEFEILFPFSENSETVFKLENFINLRVAKGVAIEHTLILKSNPNPDYKHLIQEHYISVRLSYYLF